MPGRIIGGLGAPNAAAIGLAIKDGKADTPAWKPLFDGFKPMASWIADQKPDLMIVVANDHANTFFFDRYPSFAVGVAPVHEIADEGWGRPSVAPVTGQAEFAWQLAHSLVDDEFDITVCQEMPLDHGFLTPLTCVVPPEKRWAVPVVPVMVNVVQPPIPSAARCYKLGQAIRRAVESYPRDTRVAIIGAGGLSGQLAGERYGFNNNEWDRKFLELIERDPERLARMRHQELMELGGSDGIEIIMWLVMRGALSGNIRCLHRNYYHPMVTGFGQLILEEIDQALPVAARTSELATAG